MILRWNDGNYWAVKATTEKSHRTLVKFVNKYKVNVRISFSECSHFNILVGTLFWLN